MNKNKNRNEDNRGGYKSPPCTSYRQTKIKIQKQKNNDKDLLNVNAYSKFG